MVTITQTYRPKTDDVRYRVRVGPELILELIVTVASMQSMDKQSLFIFLQKRFEHAIISHFTKSIDVSISEICSEVKKALWALTQGEASQYTTGFSFPVYENKNEPYLEKYYKNSKVWFDSPSSTGNKRLPEVDKLPGLTAIVKNPVTQREDELETVIITLNDINKWSRDKIADWLETLDIDLRFK